MIDYYVTSMLAKVNFLNPMSKAQLITKLCPYILRVPGMSHLAISTLACTHVYAYHTHTTYM